MCGSVGLVYKGYTATTTLDRSFGVVVVCQVDYLRFHNSENHLDEAVRLSYWGFYTLNTYIFQFIDDVTSRLIYWCFGQVLPIKKSLLLPYRLGQMSFL